MIEPGRYRHFKGNVYRVHAVAVPHDNSGTPLVIYSLDVPQGQRPEHYIYRSLWEFEEEVARPRFERIGD